MNQTEYLALKKTLVQGGMFERRAFIDTFTFGQLCEFAELLELHYMDRLVADTWQYISRVLAIKGSEYAFKVDGCPDRHNPDCTCPTCEIDAVDLLAVQQRQAAADELDVFEGIDSMTFEERHKPYR